MSYVTSPRRNFSRAVVATRTGVTVAVGALALLVTSCGFDAREQSQGSDGLAISTSKNSARLLGVAIKVPPATDPADEFSESQVLSCAYEWTPGVDPIEMLSPLNKGSRAYDAAKDGNFALRNGALGMSGAALAALGCAVLTPCNVGLAVVAGTIGLGGFGAAVVNLQKVEDRRKVWPAAVGMLNAQWSDADYKEAKSILQSSGNTDTMCNAVPALTLRALVIQSCQHQEWNCPEM